MKANLIKLFVLAGILVLAVIVIGGINTTSADVPAQGKPPTVALPTRVGTKPPTLTATPTKPGAQPQVGSTPVAPLKATVTRTPTRVVRSVRGSTTKSLSTSIVLVNMGNEAASVNVAYFKSDGSNWAADPSNTSFTISANFGHRIITQSSDTTMTAGQGSAVISSNQPLGGIVQILSPNQTSTWGAYSSAAPANQFYVPQILRQRNTASGLANTQIVIQSAESSGATSVTVNFTPYPGSGYSSFQKTGISLQPGASYVYDIADESSANLPDGWYGSAIVTAQTGKMITVVSNVFFGTHSMTTLNAFPASSAGPNWSVPHFTSRLPNGLSNPVMIQNLSGVDIPVNGLVMTCKSPYDWSVPSTFTLRNSITIPPNANFEFNPVINTSIPGNWSGACRLTTTDKNIVAFVQMRFPGVNANFAAYEAFRSDSTSTKVVFPFIVKRRADGFASVATIQNLDTVNSADVKLTYYPSYQYIAGGGSATPLVYYRTIAADSSLQHNHRLGDLADGIWDMPDGWYGTLYVEPQNPATARYIVGYAQLTRYMNIDGDNWMAHGAFALP